MSANPAAVMAKSVNRIGYKSLGAAAGLLTAWTFLARRCTRPTRALAVGAAAAPVVALAGTAVGLMVAADRRTRLLGLATTALGVGALSTHSSSFRDDGGSAADPLLRVTSANILLGRADASRLVGWAAGHTDVLVVQELTTESVARLSAAGIDGVFRHRLVEARPGAAGIGVWSRHPISDTRRVDDLSLPCLFVRLQVPGCSVDPTVVAIHLESPMNIAGWRDDLAVLPSVLRDADAWAGRGAVIVAGDFNSTRDMQPFRDGLAGYVDAAEHAGTGYAATFPNLRRWTIPLFVIDHILTLRCTATDVHTAGIVGSDHRALVASIYVGPPENSDSSG